MANKLQETQLSVYNDIDVCKKDFYSSNMIYCAFDSNIKNSTICSGDSGGPLIYYSNYKWYLFGLTSFSSAFKYDKHTCDYTKPSYFTAVPAYIDKENKLNFPNILIQINNGGTVAKIMNKFNLYLSLSIIFIYDLKA